LRSFAGRIAFLALAAHALWRSCTAKRLTFDAMPACRPMNNGGQRPPPFGSLRMYDRPPAKVRATLYLPEDILDEARDAAVHLAGFPARLTLTKLAENAFRAELDRLKRLHNDGRDFPPRDADLRGGRPIAA
jgi:hypothetical protein